MKNKQTYVKVAILVSIVGVIFIVVLSAILKKNQEKRDPVISKFNKVMYELSADENTYHAKEESIIIDVKGNILSKKNYEYYNDHTNFLVINEGEKPDAGFHDFVYEGYTYSYSFDADEYDVNKYEQDAGFYTRPIINISNSYFTLEDKNISYEETKEGYVFTCDNQYKIGTGYDSNGNTVSHVCDSAVAEIYLDKNWNIKKILITEKWKRIEKDGTESSYVTNTSIVFCDTLEEEVRKYLDDEYKFLESLLK